MNEGPKTIRSDFRYAVPALDKAIEVLELLSMTGRGLTATEIAESLGRSVGEIYRVLMSLEELRLIQRNADARDRYQLTMTLFEWAHRHLPTERLAKLSQPILDELSQKTKQSVMLSVLQDASVLVIAQSHSPLTMLLDIRVGAQLPVERTGAGLVALAYTPHSAFDAIAAVEDAAQRTRLRGRLDDIRSTARDKGPNPVLPDITDVTAPVFDHRGSVAASITLCYLAQLYADVPIGACEEMLTKAAGNLSEILGGAEFVPGPGDKRSGAVQKPIA